MACLAHLAHDAMLQSKKLGGPRGEAQPTGSEGETHPGPGEELVLELFTELADEQ